MENELIKVTQLKDLIEFANQGIVSKTIVDNPKVKIVLFAMAEGQVLSEHTASMPAIIQALNGKAKIKLAEQYNEALPGTLIYMPANLPHAIEAEENFVFLLTLVKG